MHLKLNKLDFLEIRRREKYWKFSKLIFIHVPKVAGVSVSTALYGRPLGHFKYIELMNHLDNFDQYSVFSIIRDPIERIKSAFNFIRNGSISDTHQFNDKIDNGYLKDINIFIQDYLQYKDVEKLDPVLQTQYSYLSSFEKNKLGDIKIFNIDDLDSLDQFLFESGYSVKFQKLNESIKTECKMDSISLKIVENIYKQDIDLYGAIVNGK